MKANKWLGSGRCGSDIEIKVINENFSVGTVNICTDESYKDKNGEWQSPANWITVKITNQKILKFADKIAIKGNEIYVEGALKTETWEKDGDKHSRTLVEVGAFNGGIQSVVREKAGESTTPQSEPAQTSVTEAPEDDGDGLPF